MVSLRECLIRFPLCRETMGWTARRRFAHWIDSHVIDPMVRGLVLGPLCCIARLLKFQFVIPGGGDRIGHQAIEVDSYLKNAAIDSLKQRHVFLVDRNNVANDYLLSLLEREHTVWGASARTLRQFREFSLRYQHSAVSYLFADYERYWRGQSLYSGSPTLSIPDASVVLGRQVLRRLGVPDGAWYVCVHVREAGFLPALTYHSFRDADIGTYARAFEHIISRGGYVVRMGDPSMTRLPAAPGIIDYAHCAHRSSFMDVYLCSSCTLFLGTNSGLNAVAQLFGRPLLLTNMAPLYSVFPGALFVPKLLFSKKLGRCLSLAETCQGGYDCIRETAAFEAKGIQVVDNDEDDILDATREMMAYVVDEAGYGPIDQEVRGGIDSFLLARGYFEERLPRPSSAFVKKHPAVFDMREESSDG